MKKSSPIQQKLSLGSGCDLTAKTAVNRLLTLKQRPVEKGLILIAAGGQQTLY